MRNTPAILDLGAVTLPETFAGRLLRLRQAPEHGRFWRALHHKRWYYAGAASADHYVGAAVVHLGYAAKTFVYVLDRAAQKFVLRQSALAPPGPWLNFARHDDGAAQAALHTPRLTVAFSRTADGDVTLSAHGKNFGLRLYLEPGETFVAANRLAGGGPSITEKTLGMRARGEFFGDAAIRIDGRGGFDLTDGYLPRHTTWHWAWFSSEKVSVNLVQDWMGASECVARVGDTLVPLGEGRFSFAANAPESEWRITTACGRVALTFTPLAVHAENENLGVVRSRFVQPCGIFSGEVCGEKISGVLGVAEKQDVLW